MPHWSRRQLLRASLAPRPRPCPATAPPPPSLEQQLLARATFGDGNGLRRQIAQVGAVEWLEQQLHPETIDDTSAEEIAAQAASVGQSSAADKRMLARAIHSKRQLAWRMVHFLNNHFATFVGRTDPVSEEQEDMRFYGHCFGSFADLLIASASSPAMIDFLDSNNNVAGNPNENYARELMELHTLGLGGGYTEADVAEVARVFTGWSRVRIGNNPVTETRFRFVPSDHDTGPKAVSFGWSTPGLSGTQGRQEGAQLLRHLAGRARTAYFFTGKLCRYFVGDAPPAGLRQRVQIAFQSSDGDLRATVRALFLDPEFVEASAAQPKTLDGFEYVVRLHRAFYKAGVDIDVAHDSVGALRSLPHRFPSPKGLPEVGAAWQGPGNLLPRWRIADDLAHDRLSGTVIRWEQLFVEQPDRGHEWVAALEQLVALTPLRDASRLILTRFMNERIATLPSNPPIAAVAPHARALLSTMLQLPELQLH